VTVWRLPPDRAAEAVDVLLQVFPDFPGSTALDPAEERRIARLLHQRTVESGLAIGRVEVWGDPPVGVAVWLRRPTFGEPDPQRPTQPSLRDMLPAEVIGPLERFDATMQRLRAIARPDKHVYLDLLGVLPAHRRHGIATALIHAGHAWADDLGLPVALDTDTDENVTFYERRGYVVTGRERLPEGDRDLVAMRWSGSAGPTGPPRTGGPPYREPI
jgi:GNAT superfamily N-acetyltransferase